jgi:hypothetical protein
MNVMDTEINNFWTLSDFPMKTFSKESNIRKFIQKTIFGAPGGCQCGFSRPNIRGTSSRVRFIDAPRSRKILLGSIIEKNWYLQFLTAVTM